MDKVLKSHGLTRGRGPVAFHFHSSFSIGTAQRTVRPICVYRKTNQFLCENLARLESPNKTINLSGSPNGQSGLLGHSRSVVIDLSLSCIAILIKGFETHNIFNSAKVSCSLCASTMTVTIVCHLKNNQKNLFPL